MIVIDCQGPGRARGRAHGEAARDLVRTALARWQEATLGAGAGSSAAADYVSRFLAATRLVEGIGAALPDLLEEIRGIAEGADVPFETIAAYNLMDEQWWYDLGAAPRAEPGCSVIAATKPATGTLLAQNMDLPAFMDGSQIVLRIRAPGQPEALVLSSAGLIGLTGVNRAGIGICVNTLLMLNHDIAGLPVAAVFRGALAHHTADGAVDFLKSVPHASGQHYAIADSQGVSSHECSAKGCAPSGGDMPFLTHTNHPLASSDVDPGALAVLEQRGRVANSKRRLDFLDGRIAMLAGMDDAKRILADRTTPICILPTHEQPGFTFGSVVYELNEAPRAQFCFGGPDKGAWHDIAWSA